MSGDWSSTSTNPHKWVKSETGGSTRPGFSANVIDTATVTITGADYTISKASFMAGGGGLSLVRVDSANATLLFNASSIRGLEIADGGIVSLTSGTLRTTRSSSGDGVFFIIDELPTPTGNPYRASLRIGQNFLVDIANTSGNNPTKLTSVDTNNGRVMIDQMDGTIQVGVTDTGVQVDQHLVISDGFTNNGTIRVSNVKSGTDTAGASNTVFEVTDGVLVNNGNLSVETGGSNGTAQYTQDNVIFYQVNRRELRLTLDNGVAGTISISNVGLQAAVLGRATATAHTNSGNIVIAAGAKLSLLANNSMTNNGTGVIRGKGELNVSASSLVNNGHLAPGDVGAEGSGGIGVLTVTGGFTSGATASIDVELAGTTAGTGYDQLLISIGTGALDGNLNISLLSGFTPGSTDTFTVIAGSVTGTFDNVVGGKLALGNGYEFDVAYNSDSVVLSNYAAVPEPAMLSIISLGGMALLRRRRR